MVDLLRIEKKNPHPVNKGMGVFVTPILKTLQAKLG